MKLKEIPALIKETFTAWTNDGAERLAAALAYYTLFSIAPLLIVVLAIAGLAFGEEAAQGQLTTQLRSMLGPEAAGAIQSMLANANRPSAGIMATVIGIATLLLGATGVFVQIQDAFNTIWKVPSKQSEGFWKTVRTRFLSFAIVLGVGFILLVSLVLSAALAAATKYLGDMLPGSEFVWRVFELASSFLVISLLFAMLYKFLPDTEVQWRDVWVGALSASALFTIGKYLIGLYLGRSSIASAYGAAGSLVVLLLWIYYAAQILYFGAELTRVYAEKYGSRAAGAGEGQSVHGQADAPQGAPALALTPIARVAAQPDPRQEALPASAVRRSNAAAFEKEIRTASLAGAALGLAIGLLRPGPRQSKKREQRKAA